MNKFERMIKSPVFNGALLFSAALLAIIISNSSFSYLYDDFLHMIATIQLGELELSKSVLHWTNDGLMVLFFLLVGLEIKRELCRGVLRQRDQVILPTIGALGGLLIPALIYALINMDDSIALRGWAIPAATDIAFSLGILALLGSRVPVALKIFLTTLAIIDDIGAIIIIALFYTADLSLTSLLSAAIAIVVLITMNRLGLKRLSPYFFVGIVLWITVLQSGVHATLAGIILAFTIPVEDDPKTGESPLIVTEHAIAPWVNLLVLPLFAFTNSGFSFAHLKFSSLLESIPLGILLGLFIGKQVGIFTTCWLLVKSGITQLPKGVNWPQMYGVSVLCGVGFTMSLFIGALAFQGMDPEYATMVRLGVLAGSLISGVGGYLIIRLFTQPVPAR